MTKKISFARVLALVLFLAFFVSGTASAVNSEIRIRVDGAFIELQYGQHPVIVEGRTLVPVRDVMSALGFAVEWDSETRTALLDKPGVIISITIGSPYMTVNGDAIALDVPARTMNGRTMVPLRAISEATGMRVHWFGMSRIADIQTTPQESFRHDMTWTFSIYSEPDFRARRVASFGAQTVAVLEERPDGWALIRTYRGEHWANLRANQRFIERRMGLYRERDGTRSPDVIHPQIVTILAQEGRWLQIATWLGPRWIDLDFTPPTASLEQLLRRHGNSLSVHFENLETGFVYRYNAGRIYASASVTKAPFALYIFQKADRGETSLDSRHRFPNGGTLTQREMLRRMLMYSCNASTFGLRDVHGVAGYRRWIAQLGGNPNWAAYGIMGSTLNLDETARFAHALHAYFESGAPHSAELRRHMLNNQIPFIVSDYPLASKTGWTSTLFHDMAIVYADSPYILIILSSRSNRTVFREISMAFQQFNDTWF